MAMLMDFAIALLLIAMLLVFIGFMLEEIFDLWNIGEKILKTGMVVVMCSVTMIVMSLAVHVIMR